MISRDPKSGASIMRTFNAGDTIEEAILEEIVVVPGVPIALTSKKLAAQDQIESLAGLIHDNAHFREILKTANPFLRRKVYDQIKPHLKFPVQTFFKLMR